jgi:hypothetical protein
MKEFKYTIIWHAKGQLTDFNLNGLTQRADYSN